MKPTPFCMAQERLFFFLLEGLSGSSGLIERCRLELVPLPRTSQPSATQAWRHVLFLFPFLHLIRATLDGNSSHSLLCFTQQILPCQSTLRRLDHVILLLTFHHHISIPYPHHIHAVALYSCLVQFLVLQSRFSAINTSCILLNRYYLLDSTFTYRLSF